MADAFKEVLQFAFESLGADEAQKLAKILVSVGDASGDAGDGVQGLVDQLAALGKQSDAIKQFTRSKGDLAEITAKLNDAKSGLAALDAEFEKSDTSSRSVSNAYKAAEKSIATLTAQQKAAQVEFAKAQGTLQKAGIDTGNLAAASATLKEKSAGVAKQIKDAGDAAKRSGDAMSGAARGAKDLGEESRKSGGLISELREHLVGIVSIAAALQLAFKGIKFGTDAFNGAADVEQSLARVQAIAQTTADSFGALQEQIEKSAIAADMTTTQTAQAAALLAEQGQSAEEIVSTLTPTLLLAKDAAIDLGEAAGIVDDSLDLFGKNASDAALMVDQLVVASKGSKDGLAGLAQGVRTLAPDARELGLTFEQLVGMLGNFAQNGIDAGKASRGLRALFQQLHDPASTFSTTLSGLGDNSRDFATAIETIRNSGDRGKAALLQLDGASRSLVEFLLQQAPGAIETFTASLAGADGAAAKTAATLDNTLRGAFTQFENSIDRIGEALLGTSLDPFRLELQKLAGQLNAFAQSPAFDELKESLRTLFVEGTQAFDNFIQSIDWAQFVTGARTAISDAASSVASFKDDIKSVGAALNEVGAIVGVVYRSIAVVFDLAKTGISQMVADKIAPLAALSAAIDKARGSTSQLTMALESIGFAAQEASDKGVSALSDNAEKLLGNLKVVGGVADDAGGKIQRAGERAASASGDLAAARASFANVEAGVKSTAAAFEEFSNVGPPSIDELRDSAKSSGAAFETLQQQILAARTRVDQARASMEALAQSGDASTDAFRAAQSALQSAEAELASLSGAANRAADAQRALKSAFAELKITSQSDLQQTAENAVSAFDKIYQAYQAGQATIEDVRAAFQAMAQAQLASVANSDASARQTLNSQLAVKASVLGITENYKALGDQVEDTGQRMQRMTAGGSRAVQELGGTTQAAATEMTAAFGTTLSAMAGWAGEFGKHSRAAADEYTRLVREVYEAGYYSTMGSLADSTGITRLGDAISKAAALMKASIQSQVDDMHAVAQGYSDMTQSQLEAMARQRGGMANVSADLAKMAQEAREGKSQFSQLGASDLGPLVSGLEAASQKAAQLAEQAKQAKQEFADMADDFAVQIAQMNGDSVKAENLQFEQQLEQLKQKAEMSGALNTEEYRLAVSRATQLHQLKLKQIAEQAEAQKKANDTSSPSRATSSGGGFGNDAAQTTTGTTGNLPPINVTVNNDRRSLDSNSLASALARALPPNTPQAQAQQLLVALQRAMAASGMQGIGG